MMAQHQMELEIALFCSSSLGNDNIPIHDMHKHKALHNALPMQQFVSHSPYRETSQD